MSRNKFISRLGRTVPVTACLLSIVAPSLGQAAGGKVQGWDEFQKNPARFMERPLLKKDQQGQIVKVKPKFSKKDIETLEFVKQKNEARAKSKIDFRNRNGISLKEHIPGRAEQLVKAETDFLDSREFASGGPFIKLEDMQARNLLSAKLPVQPWSDTYWPIYQGQLGARYADNEFQMAGYRAEMDWQGYYDYVVKRSVEIVLGTNASKEVENLSPAEKYDLLIGTSKEGYLTPSQWEEGRGYRESSAEKKVETWMGLCHGWAPAAFMLPRPTKSVTVTAADGVTKVKFYPSDIKGLATYMWAKAAPRASFIGGRCNRKDPKRDENGRVLPIPESELRGYEQPQDCWDTNPGNWHIAVVNQIGVAKRSMVLDATYDYEVWNQPILSYSYRYFNPQTGAQVSNLEKATVPAKFEGDKFAKYRSANATKIVGVVMQVAYMVETQPTHNEIDAPEHDRSHTVEYMYDLEINAAGEIIGGEWYTNKHPDFLWTPPFKSKAIPYADTSTRGMSWKVGEAMPAALKEIAVESASRYGQPVSIILDALIEASNATNVAPPVAPPVVNPPVVNPPVTPPAPPVVSPADPNWFANPAIIGRTATVTATTANMRTGPSTSFPQMAQVPGGNGIKILEIKNGWIKGTIIGYESGGAGWVHSSLLRLDP